MGVTLTSWRQILLSRPALAWVKEVLDRMARNMFNAREIKSTFTESLHDANDVNPNAILRDAILFGVHFLPRNFVTATSDSLKSLHDLFPRLAAVVC